METPQLNFYRLGAWAEVIAAARAACAKTFKSGPHLTEEDREKIELLNLCKYALLNELEEALEKLDAIEGQKGITQ